MRRIEIIKSYLMIKTPSTRDAVEHAGRLGLNPGSFYRLVRAHRNLQDGIIVHPLKRGAKKSLPVRTSEIIAEVRAELGKEVPDRIVLLETARRCAAAGLSAPSTSALRARDVASCVDLRIRLRRRFDLIVDACPLDVDVIDEDNGNVESIAWLTNVLDGRTGAACTHLVTAGSPTTHDLLALLRQTRHRETTPVVLVATGDLGRSLTTVTEALTHLGLLLDAGGSVGLCPGSALVPALGLKIGTVSLRRNRTTSRPGAAVPLRLARRVIDRMLGAEPD